ncbi:hypothetical protein [Marinicella sp. W31]|uniref:hypothetical protein n=1 Tax=Marinicella sp. W31 TaxID=3023713 RepID=UPI003757A4A8
MSVSLMSLWLPILLGGVFCWFASSIIHMFIKYHNADYKKLSNEDQVSDAIRAGNPKPGLYSMPYCIDMKEMSDPALQEKFKRGPVGMISVFDNGMPPMGKLLIQQLLFFIVAGVLIAYVATLSLVFGADFMSVFRTVMAVSFLAFGYGVIPYSVWYGHPWSNCVRFLIDALIYAAVFGATFAWLWPA